MVHRAIIALGTNLLPLSKRLTTLELAVVALKNQIGKIAASSGLFETITAYVENAALPSSTFEYNSNTISDLENKVPSHLNAVLVLDTHFKSPFSVLATLLDIEKQLGRVRSKSKNGTYVSHLGKNIQPIRPIDLDLLLFDDTTLNGIEAKSGLQLELPHPRLTERNFVLFPLSDALPGVQIPGSGNNTVHYWIENNLNKLTQSNAPLCSVPTRIFAARPDVLWAFGPGQPPKIMGILNVTPDSFSDGGLYTTIEAACERVRTLLDWGVDVIDVGGESTAPGRAEVPIDIEISRVVPIIKAIREISTDIPISVDTRKSQVLRAAIAAGADMLNDVSGGLFDPLILDTAAQLHVPVILGHMRGTSATMDSLATYDNVVEDVTKELNDRIIAAMRVGIPRWRIMADIGVGFAKTASQNIKLLRNLDIIADNLPHGIPLCVGVSRKRLLGPIVHSARQTLFSSALNSNEIYYRDAASAAIACSLYQKQMDAVLHTSHEWHAQHAGSCVAVIRTHCVPELKISFQALKTLCHTAPELL